MLQYITFLIIYSKFIRCSLKRNYIKHLEGMFVERRSNYFLHYQIS